MWDEDRKIWASSTWERAGSSSCGSTGSVFIQIKNFCDHMHFDVGQRVVITKAIIELTGSSGGSGLVRIGHTEGGDLMIVLWLSMKMAGRSCLIITPSHFMWQPMFMRWSWRAHWLTYHDPRPRVIKKSIKGSGFGGNASFTLSYINFNVIDARLSYHLLLGRPWIHKNKAIPPLISVP